MSHGLSKRRVEALPQYGTTMPYKAKAMSAEELKNAREKELRDLNPAVQAALPPPDSRSADGLHKGVGKRAGHLVYSAVVRSAGAPYQRVADLGYYFTAEMAAQRVFMHPESLKQLIGTEKEELDDNEAQAQADAEGIMLVTGPGTTGYKGVYYFKDPNHAAHPYQAVLPKMYDGKSLGFYISARHAALELARELKKLKEARSGSGGGSARASTSAASVRRGADSSEEEEEDDDDAENAPLQGGPGGGLGGARGGAGAPAGGALCGGLGGMLGGGGGLAGEPGGPAFGGLGGGLGGARGGAGAPAGGALYGGLGGMLGGGGGLAGAPGGGALGGGGHGGGGGQRVEPPAPTPPPNELIIFQWRPRGAPELLGSVPVRRDVTKALPLHKEIVRQGLGAAFRNGQFQFLKPMKPGQPPVLPIWESQEKSTLITDLLHPPPDRSWPGGHYITIRSLPPPIEPPPLKRKHEEVHSGGGLAGAPGRGALDANSDDDFHDP